MIVAMEIHVLAAAAINIISRHIFSFQQSGDRRQRVGKTSLWDCNHGRTYARTLVAALLISYTAGTTAPVPCNEDDGHVEINCTELRCVEVLGF